MDQTINATITHNQNATECLRSASHWGLTRVHNICSGAVTDIPWGFFDWSAAAGIAAMVLMFASIFLCLGWMMVTVILDH